MMTRALVQLKVCAPGRARCSKLQAETTYSGCEFVSVSGYEPARVRIFIQKEHAESQNKKTTALKEPGTGLIGNNGSKQD